LKLPIPHSLLSTLGLTCDRTKTLTFVEFFDFRQFNYYKRKVEPLINAVQGNTMKKQLVAAGFAVFSFLTPLQAKAANFLNEIPSIYAFGDSITDTGNVSSVTGGTFPPFPYFNGRFSNGPNWIDYLSQSLGLSSPTPFLSGLPPTNGINFATGGATTGSDNTIDLIPGLPGLQQQIAAFTSLIPAGASADPNSLYIVWGGANDYLPTDSLAFEPFEKPNKTITNLSTAITALAGVGAKNILVVNLPDLGSTPRVLGNDPSFSLSPDDPTPSELNKLTGAHNKQLSKTLKSLRKSLDPSLNLIAYDVDSLVDDVLANPGSFGFTNVENPCLFTLSCVLDPAQQQQYLFWDGIHPTTQAHQFIAQRALETLSKQNSKSVPEPGLVLGLFAFGFLAMGASRSKATKNQKGEISCSAFKLRS
jgi:phospholipase/lecithinase/hemolysin